MKRHQRNVSADQRLYNIEQHLLLLDVDVKRLWGRVPNTIDQQGMPGLPAIPASSSSSSSSSGDGCDSASPCVTITFNGDEYQLELDSCADEESGVNANWVGDGPVILGDTSSFILHYDPILQRFDVRNSLIPGVSGVSPFGVGVDWEGEMESDGGTDAEWSLSQTCTPPESSGASSSGPESSSGGEGSSSGGGGSGSSGGSGASSGGGGSGESSGGASSGEGSSSGGGSSGGSGGSGSESGDCGTDCPTAGTLYGAGTQTVQLDLVEPGHWIGSTGEMSGGSSGDTGLTLDLQCINGIWIATYEFPGSCDGSLNVVVNSCDPFQATLTANPSCSEFINIVITE